MNNRALSTIGLCYLAYRALSYFSPLFSYSILRYIYGKRRKLKEAGEWAVITGAGDGIGRAFALELAKDGLNVFLISLHDHELKEVVEEIRSISNVQTKVFVADFTKTNFYEELRGEINNLSSVACLVNNVGMSYKIPQKIADGDQVTIEFIRNIITCNTISVSAMCRITLPKMLQNPSIGARRFILNIASLFAHSSSPYISLYSATKAFVVNFSGSLAAELDGTCVDVQVFTPAYVFTKLSRMTSPNFLAPLPSTYAKSALDMVGVESEGHGYFMHALFASCMQLIPESWRTRMIAAKFRAAQRRQERNVIE